MTLTAYPHKPRDVVNGARMRFAGLQDEGEIAGVIASLTPCNADGARKRPRVTAHI
jgi:cytochrome c2